MPRRAPTLPSPASGGGKRSARVREMIHEGGIYFLKREPKPNQYQCR